MLILSWSQLLSSSLSRPHFQTSRWFSWRAGRRLEGKLRQLRWSERPRSSWWWWWWANLWSWQLWWHHHHPHHHQHPPPPPLHHCHYLDGSFITFTFCEHFQSERAADFTLTSRSENQSRKVNPGGGNRLEIENDAMVNRKQMMMMRIICFLVMILAFCRRIWKELKWRRRGNILM